MSNMALSKLIILLDIYMLKKEEYMNVILATSWIWENLREFPFRRK